MFLMAERRGFAGGTDRNQAIGAFRDLPSNDVPERFFVQFTIFERRYKGSNRAPDTVGGDGHSSIPRTILPDLSPLPMPAQRFALTDSQYREPQWRDSCIIVMVAATPPLDSGVIGNQ
jgi:hypothetical protein